MSERVYCEKCTSYGFVMTPGENRRRCYNCGHVFSATAGKSLEEIAPRNCGSSARTVGSVTTSLPPEPPGINSVHGCGNATWTMDEMYELWDRLR